MICDISCAEGEPASMLHHPYDTRDEVVGGEKKGGGGATGQEKTSSTRDQKKRIQID
jgi:hypothetical protein